jgi:hypothetical protein
VVGELLIGGVGISRGYYNRPELTAEKFIPDPFSGEAGGRLYRSGDLVKYLPDGNIEFIGRADEQVKVRGYRIELGEIEANLEGCEKVKKCVVLVREDQPGDKRLVAYYVPAEKQAPTSGELRDYLSERLPGYMVPNQYVMMTEIPVLSNGKVNRNQLPVPNQDRPELEEAYEAARTETEAWLVELWAEVLGLETVGVLDNFFDLGGHSLLAIQVKARITAIRKVELPLSTMFEAANIRQLASEIDNFQVFTI